MKLLPPKKGEHPIYYVQYLAFQKGITPLEFQKAAGFSDRELVWHLSNRGVITENMARGLVKVFGQDIYYWMELTEAYYKQLNLNRNKHAENIKKV